ncbi:hypothetical protein K144312032_21770 [Clostridium tetani]|uniref:hypothetical protein n=1 Tax=Clostridium tetani TaxID=1513 RepID=UPI002953EA77|nr:hypothetical protein [Clostridium tetani]BDR67949.1 hypothetical protein K144312032_21770 [Clostridium tetani]
MDISFFKNENELEGLNVEKLKKMIKEEVIKNDQIKKELDDKEKDYISCMKKELEDFLTNELNFKLNREDNNLIFEFEYDGNICRIELIDRNGIWLTYKFNKHEEKQVNLWIELNQEEYLQELEWSLIDSIYDFDGTAEKELKYKHREQNCIKWYEEQYEDIKDSVKKNISIMNKIRNKELKDLFLVVRDNNYATQKEYYSIVDLIKDEITMRKM